MSRSADARRRCLEAFDHPVIRYVATFQQPGGLRTLMYAAQGRNTSETPQQAAEWIRACMANNSPDTLRSVYGEAPNFAVCRCRCWPGHFDPMGIYFEETDIVERIGERTAL